MSRIRPGLLVLGLCAGAALLAAAPTLRADAPTEVNFQARLTQATGQPIPDGQVALVTFRMYADEPLTQFLWGEGHTGVAVSRGIINVRLGRGNQTVAANGTVTAGQNPLTPSLFGNGPRFIQVQVNSDTPLAPPIALVSVPYSLSSTTLNGRTDNELSPVGTVVDWFRPTLATPVPRGWKICDGSAVTAADDPNNVSPFRTTGVPNLLGRFTRGLTPGRVADWSATAAADVGGQDSVSFSHDHSFNVSDHSHSVNVGSAGTHNHGGRTGTANDSETISTAFSAPALVSGFNHSHAINSDGQHTHSVSVGSASNTGQSRTDQATNSFDNRPVYFGLLKLIRIW